VWKIQGMDKSRNQSGDCKINPSKQSANPTKTVNPAAHGPVSCEARTSFGAIHRWLAKAQIGLCLRGEFGCCYCVTLLFGRECSPSGDGFVMASREDFFQA
jgi:hypothetical protein